MKCFRSNIFIKKIFKILIFFSLYLDLGAQCSHTFKMIDSYGDGWNGASVDVYVNGSVVINNATITNGYTNNVQFFASHGDYITLSGWTSGSWNSEITWEILDGVGTVILSGSWGQSSYTYGNCVPNCLSGFVYPSSGQLGVDINDNLDWDAVGLATGYNVYFGTSYSAINLVSSNQPGTSYDPGTLNYNSTYYWKVIPLNSVGTAVGCVSFDFKTQANLAPPVVPSEYACPGMTVELTGTIGGGGNTLRWYDNSGTLLHTGLSYSNTYWNSTLINATSYNSFSGFESSPPTPVYVTMTEFDAPSIINYTAGCTESPFYVNATPGTGCNTVRWYDAPTGGNIIYAGNTISDILITPFNLYASSFDNVTGCESEERVLLELGLSNVDPPTPLQLDTSFCNGKTVDLYLQPSTNSNSLKWYDQTQNLIHTGLKLTEIINSDKTYNVSSFNSITGCESDQKSVINVIALPEECVEVSFNVPSAITPNADGINDLWEIEGAANYLDFTITVFNRLGQQVFLSNGIYNAWDAYYNGKPLPKGDYFYIITVNSHSYTQKGVVSIVK